MAAFTLTSTLKSTDLGAKIQATGATSGLENKFGQYWSCSGNPDYAELTITANPV